MIFKKKQEVPAMRYPIEIKYWQDHYPALSQLFKDAEADLYDLKFSKSFKGKLVPEPDNPHDPNAVMVYAAPKGRNKTFHHIGYVPAEFAQAIRPDIKKVVAGTHYWSISIQFDISEGLYTALYCRESQFK